MAIITVKVEAGKGKWAYWRERDKSVIADDVCQVSASHFAGQLGQAIFTTPCEAELHTDGFIAERPKSIWERELDL